MDLRKRREKRTETLFLKNMTENFPTLGKATDTQVQKAQSVPNKMNPKTTTLKHIVIKMTKVKERQSSRKKIKQ